MMMIAIAFLFCLVLCRLALAANKRLRGEDRLPMQWWFNGDVTWSAPRALALAFVPALATGVFFGLILLSLNERPRADQEGEVLPIFIGIGIVLLGIQLLHLWLIKKTLRRNIR